MSKEMKEEINKVKNWEQFLTKSVNISDKNHGLLLKNNKRFWIGSVNMFDGEIEEVHTYENAEDNDFHHSFYFSQTQLEKISNDECMVFWVDSDGIHGEWTHGKIPRNIIYEINKQIKVV